MVITKPLSPKSLYSRLAWVAFDARGFVETPTYFGPDRRFKIEGFPDGQGRRKGDLPVDVAESDGSDLSQNEIDSLFAGARATVRRLGVFPRRLARQFRYCVGRLSIRRAAPVHLHPDFSVLFSSPQ